MKTPAHPLMNRTGLTLAPKLAAEMLEGAESTEPTSSGDAELLAAARIAYAKEAEPIGSIPRPVKRAPIDDKLLLLVDKLGERTAFERSGVRLYDGLISKLDAYGSWKGGPDRDDLEHIRGEELEHFAMLTAAIRELGGDPTAVTPSADVHAVASKGLCAVISDPRTTLLQSMEAILTAELVDNDCWENLIDLARALGKDEIAAPFEHALAQEREHLEKVRGWLGAALGLTAPKQLTPALAQRARERQAKHDERRAEPVSARRTSGGRKSAAHKATPRRTKTARRTRAKHA